MSIIAGAVDRYSITISGATQTIIGSDVPVVGRVYRLDYKTNTTAGSPAYIEVLESGTNHVIFRDYGIASGTAWVVNYPRQTVSEATDNALLTASGTDLGFAFGPLVFKNVGGTYSAGSSITFQVFWLK